MFRISNFMRDLAHAEGHGRYPLKAGRAAPTGPVVI